MARAQSLIPGSKAVINQGDFAGMTVTIVDPRPIPDGGDHRAPAHHQRKVLVKVHDVGAHGETFDLYILPRMLDTRSEQRMAANYSVDTAALMRGVPQSPDIVAQAQVAAEALRTLANMIDAHFGR